MALSFIIATCFVLLICLYSKCKKRKPLLKVILPKTNIIPQKTHKQNRCIPFDIQITSANLGKSNSLRYTRVEIAPELDLETPIYRSHLAINVSERPMTIKLPFDKLNLGKYMVRCYGVYRTKSLIENAKPKSILRNYQTVETNSNDNTDKSETRVFSRKSSRAGTNEEKLETVDLSERKREDVTTVEIKEEKLLNQNISSDEDNIQVEEIQAYEEDAEMSPTEWCVPELTAIAYFQITVPCTRLTLH